MEGHAIGTGNGNTGQMSGSDADHMLSALAGQQVQVHFPRCSGHCGLTSQFGSGCCGEAEVGGHGAPR